MACGNCVDKLARKLMGHHKIDMIRAYELAEKAVERVEDRGVNHKIEVKSGNPTDYTMTCTNGTCSPVMATCTKWGYPCTKASDCVGGSCTTSGACGCPAPKSNSHQVSGCTRTCEAAGVCNKCVGLECSPNCSVTGCTAGTCGYDCDVGYTWNPVTLQCELPAAVHKFQGDGLTFVTT
jgi:hypothetical protein